MFTLGLAVPASDPGKPMGNIFDFDIERGWIKEVEPPA